MLLRNVGSLLQIYTASYPRRPFDIEKIWSLGFHLVRLWLKLLVWVLVKGYGIWVQLSIANEFWKRCWSVWVSVVFCARAFVLVYKTVPERSKSDDRPWHGPAKCLNHSMQYLIHDIILLLYYFVMGLIKFLLGLEVGFPCMKCSPIVHVAAYLSISRHSK